MLTHEPMKAWCLAADGITWKSQQQLLPRPLHLQTLLLDLSEHLMLDL